MKVKLIAHTPNPEIVVASAAKLCYSSSNIDDLMNGVTPERATKFLEMLGDLGHASPTEHASFTFAIEGVSRALLAQITRHRIASFSVQSQRYVRLENMEYVIPPEIEANPEAKEKFIESMDCSTSNYLALVQNLEETYMKTMFVDLDEKTARSKASKKANEDARFALPNACATKMIVTMNARSLNNFFKLRCCNRAQWEIHELADKMLALVYPVAPTLFKNAGAGCVSGKCTEGKMSCGKANEVREKYRVLKNPPQDEQRVMNHEQ